MDDYLHSRPFYRVAMALLKDSAGGVSVRQLLTDLVPHAGGERLCIYFPGGRCEPPVAADAALAECIARHDRLYPDFLARDGVGPERVAEFCVVATRGRRGGLRYTTEVIDNAGRSTGCSVVFPDQVTPEVIGRALQAEPLSRPTDLN